MVSTRTRTAMPITLWSRPQPPCRPRRNDVAPISRWVIRSDSRWIIRGDARTKSWTSTCTCTWHVHVHDQGHSTTRLRHDLRAIGGIRSMVAIAFALAIAVPTWALRTHAPRTTTAISLRDASTISTAPAHEIGAHR